MAEEQNNGIFSETVIFPRLEKNDRLLLINIEKVDRKMKSVIPAFVWTFLCEMKRIRRKVKNEVSNVDEPFD